MKRRSLMGAAISIGIAELAGLVGLLLAGRTREVYESLYQPPLSPPSWLFAVIWPLLYAMMGLAAYLVSTEPGRPQEKSRAMLLYAAQLLVNVIWCPLFFRFEYFWVALAVILVLDLLVLFALRAFSEVQATAGLLMAPYLIWILYASYLNLGVAILNY